MNSLVESSVSIGPDSKHYKMKQLVNAIQLYFQSKREDTTLLINMHLQSLSVTIDLSVFDPHSNIAPQFFVSLYELMNKMEQRSPFAWNCVDVLANACRNPAARQALINTYQFIPSLSRLLSDQLPADKKIKLLRLMQDLTCGIKISWQIPHLPHLLVTLSEWIERSTEEIITLSLGILVNLCYKNLPAIYTLMGTVDVKKILQICSAMKGPTIEIYTCKLFIILDHLTGDIPEKILVKIAEVTFDSVIEAYRVRDCILLRQIIGFFLDVGQRTNMNFMKKNDVYGEKFSSLLDIIQNNQSMDIGEFNFENRDSECISCIFEFLNFFIQIRLPSIISKYECVIQLALKWIHTDLVSSQALSLLRNVAVNVDKNDHKILEPLHQGLPIFVTTLDSSRNEESPDYIEQNLKIAGLLQLLKIMAQVPSIRPRVLEDLSLKTMCKIFGPIKEKDNSIKVGPNELDMANLETVNLYVHGIALVNELSKTDMGWMNLQTTLMQNRQTHMVLAQSLCRSRKEEKIIILEMSHLPSFPSAMVAEIMSSIQTSIPEVNNVNTAPVHDLNFPILSKSQVEKIDTLLTKLRGSFAQKQFNSVLTSDVIELYEYKLASMGNAERAAMTSVEAASERCTHLQHRNAQLTAELSRTHQLLYHVQQHYEQASKSKDNLSERVEQLQKQIDAEIGKLKSCKSQLIRKEEESNELKSELENLKKKYEKCLEQKKDLDEQTKNLKQYITRLEENSTKLHKLLEKKEETIKKSNYSVDSLNARITEMDMNITEKESELQQIRAELHEVTKELNTKKQILETITKYALTSQQISESE